MSKLEEKLVSEIEASLKRLYELEKDPIVMVEIPKNNNYGDYATNIAMRLAGILKRAPRDISAEIKEDLEKESSIIESISIDGPGFINFRIKKENIASVISTILNENKDYGKNNSGQGKKVLLEYVSANPTGDLHLGHARGAVWGDSVSRLMKASGYDVLREYYINDAGSQVDNLTKSVFARYAEYFGRKVKIPKDGYMGQDVKDIGYQLAEEVGDSWLDREEGRDEFFRSRALAAEMNKLKKDLSDFRVEFDSWISEQSLYDMGKVAETLEKMKSMDLCYEKEEALWFKSTLWGDDKDRVLVKANGDLTYLTPDIANHLYKFERGYDKLVDFWGADHHGYITRMKAALQAFGYDKDDLEVDVIQMVRLVEDGIEVKMSKRTGNAVTIRELMEDIGVDAARYFFVSRAVDTHFDFDLGLARSKTNDNPIFYIQYAHARAAGILKNGRDIEDKGSYSLLDDVMEVDLLKAMAEFPAEVAQAADMRAPNRICNYLQKLAGYFHRYYGKVKVYDPENPELTKERLAMVKSLAIVLENALTLLGISAPDEM